MVVAVASELRLCNARVEGYASRNAKQAAIVAKPSRFNNARCAKVQNSTSLLIRHSLCSLQRVATIQ